MESTIEAGRVDATDAAQRPPRAASGFRARLGAAAWHFSICVAGAALVYALVFYAWYPTPLDRISGVGDILALIVLADVILGPLLTFVVFDRRKKTLAIDLACIAAVQLAALAYGLHTIETGRPHYLVFVKDRFEVVSKADLREADLDAAVDNPAAAWRWFGPSVVTVEMPTSDEDRRALLMESVMGGRDVQHHPVRYRDIGSQSDAIRKRALPLTDLRALNPGHDPLLEAPLAAFASRGVDPARVGFLPVKGPRGDAAMLVDTSDGRVLTLVGMTPWR
jgi:hypothetical protein